MEKKVFLIECKDDFLPLLYDLLDNTRDVRYRELENTLYRHMNDEEKYASTKASKNKYSTNYYQDNREKILQKKAEMYQKKKKEKQKVETT